MSLLKPLRRLYIKSTDLTRSYQGRDTKLVAFYKVWSRCYDFSIGLDPAYRRELKRMIASVVRSGDTSLDIGCGTGISTLLASKIAEHVTGVDLSADMLRKLERKIRRRGVDNVATICGRFPEALPEGVSFDSIISSFAIVHFTPEQRKTLYQRIHGLLVRHGRLGLFSARGEIAASFETREEVVRNLELAGFNGIHIEDVSDIYRIVTAEKP
ncbi:MAG: class I SAM-dependent methyltransferase [Acidobacteria bacterium]|nr:class I SAM-dependent methyltransferase [Acidobacteriota bacterium]